MKTLLLVLTLVFSVSIFAKRTVPKFELGKIQYDGKGSCSHYMKPEHQLSFDKRALGLKKFASEPECFNSIVNFMKHINNEQTQVYVNNLFVELKNYSKEKLIVAKTMIKFKKPIVELMIENLLDVYTQSFNNGEKEIQDHTAHKDKIEQFYKLRQEIAKIIYIMSDQFPKLMKDYKEEIKKGLKHPVYTNLLGEEVLDTTIYKRETNNLLHLALSNLQ